MKSLGQFLGYVFARSFFAFFWLMPFPLLYANAKFIKYVLYRVVAYRRKLVYQNLKDSFPEKTETELRKLESAFYDNLSQIIMESIKGFSMSQKSFNKRFKLTNPKIADEYYQSGRNIIIVGGHYANWEWGHGIISPPFPYKGIVLYKPLSNKYFDNYVKRHRSRFNSFLLSINGTREHFLSERNQVFAYILAADQSPSNLKKSYVCDFLNRKTYFLHGPESYARHLNAPVFYLHVKRVKKGFYENELELICAEPTEAKAGEIVHRYASLLEKEIREKPEDWLWSHRRWKHKVVDAEKRNTQKTE